MRAARGGSERDARALNAPHAHWQCSRRVSIPNMLRLCWLGAAVQGTAAAAATAAALGSPHQLDSAAGAGSGSFEYYCSGLAAQCNNSTTAPPLPPPTGGRGGVVLMGGGTDVGEAFEWMGRRSNRGGLLVLRTDPSGDDAYDPFILGLGTVSSAATLILKDRAASSDPFVLRKVGEAASIFFAGGDQSKYWRFWQGTPLQAAVQARVPFPYSIYQYGRFVCRVCMQIAMCTHYVYVV